MDIISSLLVWGAIINFHHFIIIEVGDEDKGKISKGKEEIIVR
ncbi:MAG TPA: hypothetical protein PK559_05500 [Ignavibacteriaceae bacterium]|nr:hypothetical protein [Ignavibacteriaceae bacterium]